MKDTIKTILTLSIIWLIAWSFMPQEVHNTIKVNSCKITAKIMQNNVNCDPIELTEDEKKIFSLEMELTKKNKAIEYLQKKCEINDPYIDFLTH